MESPIQRYLEDLHARLLPLADGQVARYIPELAKADPRAFGLSIVTMDGIAYCAGDAELPFTIQSMSKPFVYAAALADRGPAFVKRKVGVEPSGDAFNSISLDPQTGAPLNPMINAGAIATSAMVAGDTPAAQWDRIRSVISAFAGRELDVDDAVYRSESATGFRNRAIGWMLKSFGVIDGEPMDALENYFRQCAIRVTCRDLAFMAATLANGGVHPSTGARALPAEHCEPVLSVMATCGMYDYAGSWLYEVGMPAKSGVGGGVLAVVPGRFGVAVFSPPLDGKGNSVRGVAACRSLSQDFGLHAFARAGSPSMALARTYTAAVAPSRRQRPADVAAWLDRHKHRIRYLSLHGFIGMDGAEYAIRQMQRLAPETDSFILDLHTVVGLSDTAARLLNEARIGFAGDGVAVVCSRAQSRDAIVEPLGKAVRRGDRGFLFFEDNDLAVEWCENRLASALPAPLPDAGSMRDSMLFRDVPANVVAEVEAATRVERYPRDAHILSHGQAGDGRVFFVESGSVSVLVPLASGAHQRIASLGPGAEFGEMALLGQTTRSASVFAESDVACRVLEADDFHRLCDRNPALKIAVLENLAKDVAARLRGANEWIAALA